MKYSLIILFICILSGCSITPTPKVYTIGETVYVKPLHTTGKLLNLTTTLSGRWTVTNAQIEIQYIDPETKMKKSRIDTFDLDRISKFPLVEE